MHAQQVLLHSETSDESLGRIAQANQSKTPFQCSFVDTYATLSFITVPGDSARIVAAAVQSPSRNAETKTL